MDPLKRRKWGREDQDAALETVERYGVNLTAWEEEFIGSLRAQLSAGRQLSERQVEVLERIYAEKTP